MRMSQNKNLVQNKKTILFKTKKSFNELGDRVEKERAPKLVPFINNFINNKWPELNVGLPFISNYHAKYHITLYDNFI